MTKAAAEAAITQLKGVEAGIHLLSWMLSSAFDSTGYIRCDPLTGCVNGKWRHRISRCLLSAIRITFHIPKSKKIVRPFL